VRVGTTRSSIRGHGHGYLAYPDGLRVEQAHELLRRHDVRSRELEGAGRRVRAECGVQDHFHHIVSVQRSEPLGAAASSMTRPDFARNADAVGPGSLGGP
jgi:hypothetical protein